MQIIRSKGFSESLQRLRGIDPELFVVVVGDLRYLIKSRRRAGLPQVRFGLAKSRHRGVMGEVRSHITGHSEFVRTIFALPQDESVCALLVLGDKNSKIAGAPTGSDWYDEAIPLADAIWDRIEQDRHRSRSRGRYDV